MLVKRLREFAAKLAALDSHANPQDEEDAAMNECAPSPKLSIGSEPDPLPIAVRAFAPPPAAKTKRREEPLESDRGKPAPPSEWTLVFDTETTVDAAQRLRIGAYQFRKGDELDEAGLFYDPATLTRGRVGDPQAFCQREWT